MQNYRVINGNSSVKSSRTIINDNVQTALSNNSGDSFPTAGLFEGMKCYRTDLKRTFTLVDVDNKTWKADDEALAAEAAAKLSTPRTISITGKATGQVGFDGSKDVSIKVGSIAADTAATATVADSAKACTGNSATASQVPWSGVTGKPSTYTPATHNHDTAYPSLNGTRATGTWPINVTGTAGSVAWGNITGKPSTGTRWPSWGEITDKPPMGTRWPSWGEITDKPSGLIKVASWDASSATLKLTT